MKRQILPEEEGYEKTKARKNSEQIKKFTIYYTPSFQTCTTPLPNSTNNSQEKDLYQEDLLRLYNTIVSQKDMTTTTLRETQKLLKETQNECGKLKEELKILRKENYDLRKEKNDFLRGQRAHNPNYSSNLPPPLSVFTFLNENPEVKKIDKDKTPDACDIEESIKNIKYSR